jgi:soluble lytic murein transglycosylase-like protein
MPRRLPALALLALALPAEAQIYTRVRNGVVEATNVPSATDYRLTYPGKGTLIHSRGFRGAYSGEYEAIIDAAAATHGVAGGLVRAVIRIESEYDRYAVSSKGAQGLMQLMPPTAQRFGVQDAFDPRQNIFAGVQYLRLLLDMFQGDISLALAGYNAGENAVLRHRGVPPYRETRAYVEKVRALYEGGAPMPLSIAARPKEGNGRTRVASGAAAHVPARPAVYYRYRDGKGLLHVAQDPPAEGVPYTLIRALGR